MSSSRASRLLAAMGRVCEAGDGAACYRRRIGEDEDMNIIELRQYTLRPGQRDTLIELFEREFIESQDTCGMTVLGQFRDLDDPDRFVWLRPWWPHSGSWTAEDAHPLDAFGGLRAGAGVILGHVARRSRITVHGDYDVDGICSTAILVRALRDARRGRGLVPAEPDRRRLRARRDDRRAARRAGTDPPVTVDARSPRWPRSRREGGGDGRRGHRSPHAARRRRAAGRDDRAPTARRYPCPDLCAAGVAYMLAGALLQGAGEDPAAPTRTSTSSRSRPSPTSCRSRARTAGSSAPACVSSQAVASRGCAR